MTITQTRYAQLPALRIAAPDGAEATVTLYGAHLISWKGADGQERLFCSTRSALDGSAAIRGGVPVIFPQFSTRGSGLRHGFARISQWRLEDSGVHDGAAFAVLGLAESDLEPALAAAWPHKFKLALRVEVRGNELQMILEVRNTGAEAFPFAAALHTYHQVDAIEAVRIDGVEADTLAISGKIDKVYENIGGTIGLASGARALKLEQRGFTDAVVWNPGAADAAALADMADDEYQRFVCIEPAALAPAALQPGAAWRGEYRVGPQD
jgi:glucose-6-phosphate 1-epimerase